MPDSLWKRAETDLCLRLADSPQDSLIWEHSARVAKLAETIRTMPGIPSTDVDPAALAAAALYHDAAWVLQAREGEVQPSEMLLRPCSDLHRELGADWLTERLKDILGPGVLVQAARTVRELNNRRSPSPDVQILAEADSLDQIGPQTMLLMLRRQLHEGKSLKDLIDVWERQEEYNFWPARIKESFRFAAVRRIAEARLEKLRRFMNDLRQAVRLEDVAPLHASG